MNPKRIVVHRKWKETSSTGVPYVWVLSTRNNETGYELSCFVEPLNQGEVGSVRTIPIPFELAKELANKRND